MTVPSRLKAFLHLTQQCNLRCAHCQYLLQDANHFAPGHLKEWEPLLDHFAEIGVAWCTVSAEGEPLLHPEYDAIIAGLKARGIPCSGVTNGTVLHKHIRAIVENMEGMTVSLDAHDAALYGRIRGKAELYDTVVDNIRNLVTYKNSHRPGFRVSAKFDLHKDILHSMEPMIEKGLSLGVDSVHFGTINDEGTGALTPLFKGDGESERFVEELRTRYAEAPVVWPSFIDMDTKGACDMLFDGIVINSDHALSPCCHIPGDADLFGTWKNPAPGMISFRDAFTQTHSVDQLPVQCRHCHRRMWKV